MYIQARIGMKKKRNKLAKRITYIYNVTRQKVKMFI